MTPKPYRHVGHGDKSYPVFIGPGLVENLFDIAEQVSGRKSFFVVSSPHVSELVKERLAITSESILMNDREQDKTLATVETLLTELARRGARRDSLALLIGGGVVGDTAGFAASIYLRGIEYIHVPTTLLAQVDSSIGGKVAVNHPLGKNLIGSFHSPMAVISDLTVLSNLPERERRSGMFEALKAGVVGDPRLFELIPDGSLEEIIQRAVDVKAEIVSADAGEADRRRLLNYGHTIGHGIEAALDYQKLTHGDAIAWGMIGANAIARRRNLISSGDEQKIRDAILRMSPEQVPRVDTAEVLRAIDHDKKFTAGRRVMILAKRVGDCVIVDDVSESEIHYGIDAALNVSS